MNPPALLHNLNLTSETETVFSSQQVARDIERERRREERRQQRCHWRSRRQQDFCCNWKKNCQDVFCAPNALLVVLALVGFSALVFVYYLFGHVIEW
ncbi:hypothetical protein L596_000168 [Steinernema carpocapsae]|uniref:Uncharacterized protein n=1 Tax=Steinernema carpocapsae TaxID=34508 RepID=A0A4U8UJI0_STECR|nr:hypothetical protein L596_000168 [Steinernema carpocapsae]